MRWKANLLFALAAIAVAAATTLVLTRGEGGKAMRSGPGPLSGAVTWNLPDPMGESGVSIESALRGRRSIRAYGKARLSLQEVAQLLWAAQGITHGGFMRTAPSAGALYPLETYLVAGDVENLPAGVYRYLPERHQLAQLLAGDLRDKLCRAAHHQGSVCSAPAAIVFSAVFSRTTGKYGRRGVRYVHMEAGAAAQNVALQAVSLGLGTVVIGAFDDEALRQAFSMPNGEEPMLIMPVGRVR